MEHAVATAPADTQPDPPKDPPAPTLPGNIAGLVQVARYLLGYGRHLVDTLRQRAAAPSFDGIAACFGTANLTTILAHLHRGILRCVALERVLLARAATGKDIAFIERHTWTTLLPEPDPEPAQPEPRQQPAVAHTRARKQTIRASRPTGWDDPELFMPTLEDLERQIRRQPIGRVFSDICLDLAVVPGFCHPAFWNALFEIMTYFGSSVNKLMQEKTRRRAAFDKEQDRKPGASWDWVNIPRDKLRDVLGFFIGEPPINPFDPAAAIATAPP
jgi:hypothetical protein